MILRKFCVFFWAIVFFHSVANAEYFTPQEVLDYNQRSLLQWNVAQQAINDNRFMGNEKVLDIGCGDGRITAFIAKKLSEGSIRGIDISKNMIAFAQEKYRHEKYSNLSFETADANQITYQEEFDVIVSFFCLHWLNNQQLVLEKICDGLKFGGKTIISVPSREVDDFPNLIYTISKMPRWSAYFQKSVNTRVLYTIHEYEALLKNAGFSHVDCAVKDIESVFTKEELEGWMYPIISKNLTEEDRSLFFEQVIAEMKPSQGWIDSDEKIHVFSKNIQATAYKDIMPKAGARSTPAEEQ